MKRIFLAVALLCSLSWSASAQDSKLSEDPFKSLIQKLAKEREAKNPISPPLKRNRPIKTISQTEADLVAVHRLAAMIAKQVQPCWAPPVDADVPGASVSIELWIKPDGTYFSSPQILGSSRVRTDPALRALAISALRARRDPRSTPLKLPIADYALWKKIVYTFQP
mgnify:CR=1 FL=1